MSQCVIITAHMSCPREVLKIRPDDFVLCADGGYRFAQQAGVRPAAVIGDFDSGIRPDFEDSSQIEVLQAPVEKDETDTFLCIRYGMEKGCRDFLLLGGLSGRLDHTMANLQLLEWGNKQELRIRICDGNNEALMVGPEAPLQIPLREGWKLSVLSWTERAGGVCLRGVKYPLENAQLERSFPLGVSNEFQEEMAEISCKDGLLLLLLSKEGS